MASSRSNVSAPANYLELARRVPSLRTGSALTCLWGTWQLSRRGLSLPLLSGIASNLAPSERKRNLGLFFLPLPPRTSDPRGRGATAAVTASHWPTAEDTRTGCLSCRPAAPTLRAAEPEVRRPEVACPWPWTAPLSLNLARPSRISMVPARLPRGLLRPSPGGWPRPSRCGPSNHIRGSAGAVARVIFWLRPITEGCAPGPGAPARAGSLQKGELAWSWVVGGLLEPSASLLSHSYTPASRVRRTPSRRWAGGGRVEMDVTRRHAYHRRAEAFSAAGERVEGCFSPAGSGGWRECGVKGTEGDAGASPSLPPCLERAPPATSLTPTPSRKTRPPSLASLTSWLAVFVITLPCSLADGGPLILFVPAPVSLSR